MTLRTSNHLDGAFDAIYTAVAELNLQRPKNKQIQPRPDVALFGEKGQLDSLGLANFIVITEQKLEHSLGIQVDLTQGDPFSGQDGHFKTIESLARYVSSLIENRTGE
jgi:acyl carrier protein